MNLSRLVQRELIIIDVRGAVGAVADGPALDERGAGRQDGEVQGVVDGFVKVRGGRDGGQQVPQL